MHKVYILLFYIYSIKLQNFKTTNTGYILPSFSKGGFLHNLMDVVSFIISCFKSAKMLIKREVSFLILRASYARLLRKPKLMIQSLIKFILKFCKIVQIDSAKPMKTSLEGLNKSKPAKGLKSDFQGLRSIYIQSLTPSSDLSHSIKKGFVLLRLEIFQ
jgi:hypothetical protein